MKVSAVKQLKVDKHFTFYDLLTDKSYRFVLLFLTIIPLLIFWQATRFEFVWDDIDIHIIDNPYLNPPTAANIWHFWTHIYQGLYIPVAHSLWALIKIISSQAGLKPNDTLLYHLANLILHSLNGLLVFTLLRQLIQN